MLGKMSGFFLVITCCFISIQLGPTPVMFMERRVLFGQVPLHLTTTRTAVLHNNSQNHAYFQVSARFVLNDVVAIMRRNYCNI